MEILYKDYSKLKHLSFKVYLATRTLKIILLAPYYRKKLAKYINGKYYLALGFDGTIVEDRYPNIGPIKDKTFRKLLFYHDMLEYINIKLVIILWTCRYDEYLDAAKDWMKTHLSTRIIPTYYNENPERGHGSPKIFAHEYWDDCGRRIK